MNEGIKIQKSKKKNEVVKEKQRKFLDRMVIEKQQR